MRCAVGTKAALPQGIPIQLRKILLADLMGNQRHSIALLSTTGGHGARHEMGRP